MVYINFLTVWFTRESLDKI